MLLWVTLIATKSNATVCCVIATLLFFTYIASMDWDNFRLLSSLARTGTVRGTAAEMGVNASTVTRRLDQLEQELDTRLFIRSQQGLFITEEAAQLVTQIDGVGHTLKDIEAGLRGQNSRLAGKIRFAVPDVFAVSFLLQELADFTEQYPDIDLEIIPGYQDLNLAVGETDVALRATEAPPESMVGRPLTKTSLAVYASRQFLAKHGIDAGAESFEQIPWIDWAAKGEVMALYERLRRDYFPDAHVHIRCDQIQMQYAAVSAHMGLAILPVFLAAADPQLVQIEHMPTQAGPTLWLLTHPNLRNTRRIQLFMNFVREIFERHQPVLSGGLG